MGVSPSVVMLWAQRVEQTGSVAAKPSGSSTSPLEEHAGFLPGSDYRAAGNAAAIRKQGIPGSRSAVWRFFDRRDISFKKTLYAAEQKRAEVARERRRWRRSRRSGKPILVRLQNAWAARQDAQLCSRLGIHEVGQA